MITKDVTIDIKQATDASPVAKCVQLASQFKSKIYIENGALEYCDKDYDILKIVADNIADKNLFNFAKLNPPI